VWLFHNYYWEHYPLGVLYFRHINAGYGHEYAFDQAAKDAGKILKGVLQDDNRVFEPEGGIRGVIVGRINKYFS